MVRLKTWQWVVLALPIAAIVSFLLVAAGTQIHEWNLNWIWAIFTLVLVGWRWLLVQWTQPMMAEMEAAIAQVNQDIEESKQQNTGPTADEATQKAEIALQKILETSRNDAPIWEDLQTFGNRCQEVVTAIALIYNPEVKYPLLNIYIPQAYGLIRGTVDDLDRWMQQLSPALNQVTVGQAFQAYEMYRKLEPSARKLFQVWNWVQWFVNPAVAAARLASQGSSNRATQELLVNLGQLLREAALRNLSRQAATLYGNRILPETAAPMSIPALPKAKTQTLREIISQTEPVENIAQKPVNILLVGRTGAGKSSLINTLFDSDRAEVDLLPSTDLISNYHWQSEGGETLILWDTPGYEQAKRADLRQMVLDYGTTADLLLLVTPALDPALQMDVDFLKEIKAEVSDLPAIAIVTQVDRLRPIREWNPPYDWVWGDKPKEKSIREATQYRTEQLGEYCDRILPIVTQDSQQGRVAWNTDTLAVALIEAIDPAKQQRLARFLRDRESRIVTSAKIIDRYTFQMATTQGVTSLLKTPVLQFISTLSTGSPTLAYALAEQIPVEQLPMVIGKLQMAYDLFNLLNIDAKPFQFDLLSLWPLLRDNRGTSDRNAWAFGHALVEYWTQKLTLEQLRSRFESYLEQQPTS
ncbi:GTPase family protein [Oscillatoria acuminata]|uniref:Putative GTPase n=1 Tax=Oscillatoria acuminata PCC 6304 TaxID=56110 RepID=K9TPD5_9CYAN|nr:GTPase family protein [Oscillatoria acuminata]AFY84026.1 putative GTPase [Oscillatoria acuminata PCC 6304]